MKLTGHCYCGELAYEAEGEPMFQFQCHCRECQYITGGMPNTIIAMPIEGFRYTRGEPAQFTRPDLENGVTREFCPNCGTAIGTRSPGLPAMIIKVGTLDDPSVFQPGAAIQTADAQPFHHIPEGMPSFERFPG